MTSSETNHAAPRAARPALGRRTLLAATGGVPLLKLSAADAAEAARPTTGFARFEWLGTTGWRVRTPTTTLLMDPYLTRFDTGLAAGSFNATTPLSVDTAAIDKALGAAGTTAGKVDAVLVSHTHWDHFGDVPQIATSRKATVFTTLTGYHLAQAMGVPAGQLAVVKGGEELHLGDVVVRVVRSLHSRSGNGGLLFPGLRAAVPSAPRTIADLPEGDTLGFVITSPQGRRVLLLGASDYDDQALTGLEVDTVALPVPSNDVTAGYVPRLLQALDRPGRIVLTHWDNFETPLVNPPRADAAMRARMDAVLAQVRRHSPRTKVLTPTYLSPMSLL